MPKTATSQSDILTRQVIDESSPGTILRDFQTLLDFVGTDGMSSGGKNHRIPLARLKELDERMTHPLRPALDRPQQVSYPHLNGLYLLLRSTGLGVSSGEGDSGRISLNAKRLDQWNALNPEERYFTLLHVMFTSDWSPIDSDASSRSGPWHDLQWGFRDLSEMGIRPTKAGVPVKKCFYHWHSQTTAALLELFGILEIPRVAPQAGENWRIKSVRKTDLGIALFDRLLNPSRGFFEMVDLVLDRVRENNDKRWLGDFFRDEFPNCRNTLTEDEGEFVDGIWQFKVSLGDVWRRIVIPADSNVDELIEGIIDSFKFDFDHLYELQLRDRSGRNITIGHPATEDTEYYTDEFAIGSLPLDPGQTMTFLYDFGDSWRFAVKLEKILPSSRRMTKMKIIEKKGKSPAQYENSDEWDD
ncbi:MAG: hypothetical protein EXS05_18180 [Planctomycetaceae bacterium]|nr:hypothetical protein [Planctomycetaceae bacterium]